MVIERVRARRKGGGNEQGGGGKRRKLASCFMPSSKMDDHASDFSQHAKRNCTCREQRANSLRAGTAFITHQRPSADEGNHSTTSYRTLHRLALCPHQLQVRKCNGLHSLTVSRILAQDYCISRALFCIQTQNLRRFTIKTRNTHPHMQNSPIQKTH